MVKVGARLKARRDASQMVIAPKEKTGQKRRGKPIPAEFKMKTGKFHCPFCLHIDVLTAFLVTTKKGWSRSNGRCPECQEGFRLHSLTMRMMPAEFGEWVYNYPAFRFWRKCSFEKFSRRLKMLGWAYPFWKAYKALKESDTSETYEEHLYKEQEAWAREQGYIE